MFAITIDPARKLLRVTLSGLFDLAEVSAFSLAAQGAVRAMGCDSGGYLHLCDISGLRLQTQAVADAFSQFTNQPGRRSYRLAIVTGHASVRMQIRRLLQRTDAAIFRDSRDAEAWLLGPADMAPAQAMAS